MKSMVLVIAKNINTVFFSSKLANTKAMNREKKSLIKIHGRQINNQQHSRPYTIQREIFSVNQKPELNKEKKNITIQKKKTLSLNE